MDQVVATLIITDHIMLEVHPISEPSIFDCVNFFLKTDNFEIKIETALFLPTKRNRLVGRIVERLNQELEMQKDAVLNQVVAVEAGAMRERLEQEFQQLEANLA